MALQWSTLSIPLAAGLSQKGDARAGNPPQLDICVDAQFDEIGGLQTRYPFASFPADIYGAGTFSDARRFAVNGDELLCFTKSALLSWSPQLEQWVSKGTHLAIKIEEQTQFATTGDQVECDRAELNGTIVYVWREAGTVYIAARDKTSGAVIAPPTSLTGFISDGAARPRVVATATKILVFYVDDSLSADLFVKAIDPASPTTGIAAGGTSVYPASSGFNLAYDVVKVAGADTVVGAARLSPTTSYLAFTVTAGLVVTTAVKARVCDTAIGVSCVPTGTHVQIVRTSGTAVQGDTLSLAFADVYTGQALGTVIAGTVNQIAVAHRSVTDAGQYRAYAFWSANETSSFDDFETSYNWVDTSNTIGTAGTLAHRVGVASRAFDREGRVFLWTAYAAQSTTSTRSQGAQIQNHYFLYRDDAFLCGKAAYQHAGGFADTTGHLPGVINTSGATYSWLGSIRRVISLGDTASGYDARAPQEISFTFDSDEARRTARIGATMLVTGGEILQYDKAQLTELGFHLMPATMQLTDGGATGLADGLYAVKASWRWDNAVGEMDRSSTACSPFRTIVGGPLTLSVDNFPPLHVTHKTTPTVAVELWRTTADPTADSPFYLITDKDPSVLVNPNRYLLNVPTSNFVAHFEDQLVDASVEEHETHPDNGGDLESLAPPAASIIAATDTRVFLAGVAGDPDRVWYSKQCTAGQVPAFHDALTIPIPAIGGAITALGFLNETLVVFRENAIYAFPGDGFANDASGSNYGPSRTLSSDLGAVNAESIAVMAQGLIFKSSKGWYVLNRGWGFDYVGAAVCDFDDETPVAVHVLTSKHQVRILSAERLIVWDYLVNQWGEWTITAGIDAAIWGGAYRYLTETDGPYVEQTSYTGVNYGMDIETPWIKLDDLQGFGRVRRALVLGEYRSAHAFRIRIARDYKATATEVWDYFDDLYWVPVLTTVGGPEQVRIGPSQQQCQAIKIRITVIAPTGDSSGSVIVSPGSLTAPTGEAVKFTGLALEVGVKRGPYKMLPSTQKT